MMMALKITADKIAEVAECRFRCITRKNATAKPRPMAEQCHRAMPVIKMAPPSDMGLRTSRNGMVATNSRGMNHSSPPSVPIPRVLNITPQARTNPAPATTATIPGTWAQAGNATPRDASSGRRVSHQPSDREPDDSDYRDCL
jgi:hypothetical protein